MNGSSSLRMGRLKGVAPSWCLLSALLTSTYAWGQREHTLMPSPETVHVGNFNAALKPVLTVESGDIVTLESAGAIEPAAVDQSGVVPPSAVPDYVRAIYREVKDRGPGGHVLTGPIAVTCAMPVMCLKFASSMCSSPSITATTVSARIRVRCPRSLRRSGNA